MYRLRLKAEGRRLKAESVSQKPYLQSSVVSLLFMVVVAAAVGCESLPTGAASRDGGIGAPLTIVPHRRADVSSHAYASFSSAVLLHTRSDQMLSHARRLVLGPLAPSARTRRRLHKEARDLWNQAVQRYQTALAYDPKSVTVCKRLVQGFFDRGDSPNGIRWLKRAVAIDNGDFKLLYRLGLRCERARRMREAVHAYVRAEKARDDADKRKFLPLVILKLGSLYETQKKFDRAADAYKRFLQLKRETDETYDGNSALIELLKNRAPVYRKLGEAYGGSGKHKEAAQAFAEAYRLQPRVTRSLRKLAEAYAADGEYKRALDVCKQYIEKEPNRLDGMTFLVEIYRKMGQPDRAVSAAEQFLREKPLLYQLHYLLGTLYEEKGDPDRAVAAYERITRGRKPFLPAYLALVKLAVKRAQHDKALKTLAAGLSAGLTHEMFYVEFDRTISQAAGIPGIANRFRLAVQVENQDFAFYYVLGRLLQEMSRSRASGLPLGPEKPRGPEEKSQVVSEAIQAYTEAIRLKPDFTYCYIRLASLYIFEDKAEEAVKVLTSASERDAKNVLVWRFLADAQVAAGDKAGAVDSMKRAVFLDPGNTSNILLLVGLMNKAARTEEAERFLMRSLEKHPEEAERWTYILANFYIDHGRKLDRAVEVLKDALRTYPESRRLTVTLGSAYLRLHNYAEAAKALRRAVDIDPRHTRTRVFLALALERDGKPAEAEKELREVVRLEPDRDDWMIDLGNFLVRTRRQTTEGIALIKRAVAANPDSPSNRLALGSAYLNLKRNEDAVKVFAKLLKDNPRYTLARYQLAMAYDEMDRFAEAERELQRILKDDPDDGPAANALGYMYAERAVKLDEAGRLIEIALKQEPENGAYLDSMGWVFYKKGDLRNALEYLKKAISHEPDPVIADHLGDVHVRLGETREAVKRYEEAVKLDPRSETKAARKLELLKAGKDPLE